MQHVLHISLLNQRVVSITTGVWYADDIEWKALVIEQWHDLNHLATL